MDLRCPLYAQIADAEARIDALTVTQDGEATLHQGHHLNEHRRPPAIERKETLSTRTTASQWFGEKGCGVLGLPRFTFLPADTHPT
jgi:hypothetical protein